MTRLTLHIPLFLNDGTPTPESALEIIESDLLTVADGFTATDGIGAWRSDDGTTYREPVRLYAVDTDRPEYDARHIRHIAEWAAANLEQEAVYVTHAPIAAQLYTSPAAA